MARYAKAGAAVAALVVALSPVGLDMMTGFESVRYEAYPDPYYGWTIATICYGHTAGVQRGDTATEAECQAFLDSDVNRHCGIVYKSLVAKGIWLTEGEQDAYCSFVYNFGSFTNTPSVYGRLIKGDDYGACEGLLLYTYSNGKYSRGLANRRYREYQLCISELDLSQVQGKYRAKTRREVGP